MQGVLDGMNEVVREKRKGHAVKWGQRLNFCAKERGIAAALDSPTEGDFTDTPLDDVLRYVEKRHHITIRVDEDELKQEGLDSDCLVTANWHRISLRSALRALLKPLSLPYSVEDGALVVTPSPDLMVRQRLTLAVYVIDDLIGQRGVAEPWKAPEPFGALTPPYFAGMPTGRTDPSRRWPGPARAATLTLGGTCFLFVSSAYREQEDMAATFAKMRLAANRKARGEILPAGTEIGESDGESKDCSATRVYSIEGLVDVKEENGVRSLDAERLIRELSAAVGPVSWEPAFACYMAAYTVGGAKVLVVTQADDVHRKIARWLAERAARMPALPSP